jgi:hypothetical protein
MNALLDEYAACSPIDLVDIRRINRLAELQVQMLRRDLTAEFNRLAGEHEALAAVDSSNRNFEECHTRQWNRAKAQAFRDAARIVAGNGGAA